MARFCSTQGAKGSTVRNRLLLSLIRSVIGKPGQNLILVMIKAANLKVVHLAYGPLYWSSLRHCSQPWRGPACSLRPSHKRQWNSQLVDDGALASLEPTFEGDGRHKNAKEGFSFTATCPSLTDLCMYHSFAGNIGLKEPQLQYLQWMSSKTGIASAPARYSTYKFAIDPSIKPWDTFYTQCIIWNSLMQFSIIV